MNSAWGVFLSVAVSAIAGYIALIVLTDAIPPGRIAETAANPYPVLYIVRHALAPFFANAIAVIIAGAMWLCGLTSITSMARMCFAFARDRGMPAWRLASRIDPRWSTPAIAIVMTSLLAFLATVYSAAYSVITSMSTTSLYLAYSIPIYLNWRNRRRRQGEFTDPSSAPWNLGRYGPVLNLVAIAWIAFITILFSIPPNELAGLTTAAALIGLMLYWLLAQQHRFRRPAVSIEKSTESDLHSASIAGRRARHP